MNYGVVFDPAILEFAVLMLAKTSRSAYELIRPVLKLPSLEWILNLQKQQAGSQDERNGSFGIVGSAVKAFATAFDNENILDDKLRKMDVCYDSFITVKRVDHDFNNGIVGIDPHLDFRVIKNKFFQMVSLRQIKNVCVRVRVRVRVVYSLISIRFFASNNQINNNSLTIHIRFCFHKGKFGIRSRSGC